MKKFLAARYYFQSRAGMSKNARTPTAMQMRRLTDR